MGDVPVHVPVVPVSVWPTTVDPDTVGSDVFFGALDVVTVEVAAESALVWPAPLVAVTRIRSRKPASALAIL